MYFWNKMRKKLLIDAERLRYPNSGVANVAKSLIAGMQTLETDLPYMVYGTPESLQEFPRLAVLSWQPWHRFLAPHTDQFALVHVTHQLSSHFHSVGSHQKKVVTLHDLNFLHDQSSERKRKKSVRLVQKNIGNADAIVFISNFAREDFHRNRHLFTTKKEVVEKVIYNGLIFPEQRKFRSDQLAYLLDRPFILNVGVLFPKKNQKVLLPLLVGNHKRLVMVASDAKEDYKGAFLHEAVQLGVADRLVFLENISENDKYFLLQHCESLCHPSLAEGFGIPPVEAMFFGKPVFLSAKTSLPEIGGDAAFYFEDFQAETVVRNYQAGLEMYHSNPDAFSVAIKGHARKYSYLEMARNYADFYRQILAT